MSKALSFFVLSAALCGACTRGSGGVTRMADGVRYDGRFINPEAYAGYLLGVQREARGDFEGALSAYREAHAEDPDSPEIWARIGAVRCVTKDAAGARKAFEQGIREDEAYYGNYFERARCAERTRDDRRALPDALKAVSLRPRDEPANLLVARLLEATRRPAEARAWLEAFQSFHPSTVDTERSLAALRGSAPPAATSEPPSYSRAFSKLRAGEVEQARKLAQTELDADPTNADSWIAVLVACDSLHDEACFDAALGALRTPSLAPSPAALAYLQALLVRRTGTTTTF